MALTRSATRLDAHKDERLDEFVSRFLEYGQ